MTTKQEQESKSKTRAENGADVDSMRSRVADLLDNVTVNQDEAITTQSTGAVSSSAGNREPDGALDERATTQPDHGDNGRQDGPSAEEITGPAASNGAQDGRATVEESERSNRDSPLDRPVAGAGEHDFLDLPELPDLPDDIVGDSSQSLLLNAVKIKGRAGGVAVEVGDGEWDALMKVLEHRLHAAEGFFRGGRVVLEVGNRPLIESDLRQIQAILEEHEMILSVVRSTVERTLQAALEIGLITSTDDPEPPPVIEHRPKVHASAPKTTYFVYRGHLRSGQVLRKSESIVIVGDVNPGAQVISSGDIMIWGRLRGVVHAGAGGNKRAVITALELSPSQLRIAHLSIDARKPRSTGRRFWFWQKEPERRAEVAYISDGKVVVEPWDESKSGSLINMRR